MLTEIAIIGSLAVSVAGLFQMSTRPRGGTATELSSEAAIRAAMRGPEGRAVSHEFRRRGIIGPADRRHGQAPSVPLPF